MRFQPGDHIDGFELIEPIAAGATAEVFRARSTEHGDVALKLYLASERVDAEVAVLQAAAHRNVVRYVDHGASAEPAWLATEWVEGRTLDHLIATEGPLPPERAGRLLGQLGDAVDALHQRGIVHGDLSPNNMIVDIHDRLVLLDLGESRRAERVDETTDLDVATTPRYAAPEVARGEAPMPASDRYAVALIAYEAIVGAMPYPEVETPIAMLGHHASTEPTPPTEINPALPAELEQLLLDGLAKSPEERPATASAFAAQITAAPSISQGVSEGQRQQRGQRRYFAAAALVLAAIVGILGVTTLRSRDQPLVETATIASDTASTPRATTVPPTSAPPATAQPTPLPTATPVLVASSTAEGWTLGAAAGTLCNLLNVAGFEQPDLASNYYLPDPAGAPALVPGAGYLGSTAMRIGANGAYSLFGEIVPVEAGETYVFSTWARIQGSPVNTGLYVDFLDEAFDPITERSQNLAPDEQDRLATGGRIDVTTQAPPNAAYAVPTFYKDGSSGSMLVDEVVFGRLDQCDLSGAGT